MADERRNDDADGSFPKRWDRVGIPAVIGGMLLLVYLFIAMREDFFQQRDFDYWRNPGFYLRTLYPPVFTSIFWKTLLLFPATTLLAWAWSSSRSKIRIPHILQHRRLPTLLSVVSLSIIILVTALVFHGTEVTDDELTYEFQAKTLLAGRISNPPPIARANFDNVWMINDGYQYIGMYPFGHPMILALGMLAGSQFLLPIVMSMALIFIVAGIARALYKEDRLANLAAILLFLSPFFYLMSASRLSHTSSAFLLGLFFLIVLKLQDSNRSPIVDVGLALIAGIAAGLAANIRPLTAIAFLLPFLPLLASWVIKKGKMALLLIGYMGAGFSLMVLLTLLYNREITGSVLVFPIAYYDPNNTIGFNPYFGHTPAEGFANIGLNIARMNVFLFGFPWSLLLVSASVFFGLRQAQDLLLLGIVGSFLIAYFFFWSPGVGDLGPVYYYDCIIPLILLSGRGLILIRRQVRGRNLTIWRFVICFFFLSFFVSLSTFVPEKITEIRRLTDEIRKPYQLFQENNLRNAIVFFAREGKQGWIRGMRNNSPGWDDEVIICALADSSSNDQTLSRFSSRMAYVCAAYGTPRRYLLQQVDRKKLLSTNWSAAIAELEARMPKGR